MPRKKPLTCHTCGETYTTFLCPKCHPNQGRKKRRRGGSRRSGGRGRRSWDFTARALANPPRTGMGGLAIHTDALPGKRGDDDEEAIDGA